MYGLCCPLPVKLQTPQYDSAMMLTMMMLMMTMMILVGEGKGCTRHLTNSLSTQPDDDDVDDDDVVLDDVPDLRQSWPLSTAGWLSNAVPDWSAHVETLGANIFGENNGGSSSRPH